MVSPIADVIGQTHMIVQTSMFVPEPVISLAIKPQGQETPNFSRALNRFQKEDPTFRVHIDSESKEVYALSLVAPVPSHPCDRPLYLVWVNSISRYTSNGCVVNTASLL